MQALQLRRVAAFGSVAPARPARASQTIVAAYGNLPNVGGGRKWKHLEVNENGNVERISMHVKKGDFVQVIAGKDKGKTGTITRVLPKTGLVVVEGVNIKTKHIAPKQENEQGKIEKSEYPLHHSNVQHFSKEKQVRSRIGHKMVDDGRKVRYLIKTGELLD
mmetsp:Transcript_32721/g.83014  ORF Transcript_32721/g.83014 Transcript_32721/m.83014 type:complete len:162 (-) Transcript_32721:518-1003(-)|eukprot:CAMPEP_0202866110 /NCGR_PEP_ID=MMETSP1391-20130828/7206_1 /ASSEMBLY_ACC=CAM_ASM_000867 /TAXON_ID=1034604 /ORGANISM="Chlamydomonas leiostraca, Strain SAG 11-49" /LENGTH=161 /DNA_ID=CAMNT_0049546029 /DNA_START=9 /DNA_END=494 /DNA_ORIENTATION=+